MSNYYLLIAVIIALAIGAVKGYRKGFLRLAVWFASLIAVLFIVTKISPYVSDFLIKNTSINDNLREKIITVYEEKSADKDTAEKPPGEERENEVIDTFGFPQLITDSLKSNNTSEIYDKLAVTIFRDYIAGYLSELSIKAGTFVGLFIMLWIIGLVIILAINIMEKIPVLRTFNRLLGMAAGITLSLVFVWLFFLAVMMFFGHTFGGWVFAQVKASRFLTYIFNNNILFELVK
ncbi:MAG: CvpA family protein [Lachnospiraceae bacterium]|nr:CvpA family protein [Lachnospiraceae bacterium]